MNCLIFLIKMSFLNNDKTKQQTDKKNQYLKQLRKERRDRVLLQFKPKQTEEKQTEEKQTEIKEKQTDTTERSILTSTNTTKSKYQQRKERKQRFLKVGHILENRKLLFSEDNEPIPYIDEDIKGYFIDGTTCFNLVDDNAIIKFKKFKLDNNNGKRQFEHVQFLRLRRHIEDIFMKDYYKLVSYSRLKDIEDFEPKIKDPFTLGIFKELKDNLKNIIIKEKEEKAKEKIKNYNPEQSKKRLENLIDNHDYNKQLNKINIETQKQLKNLDKEYNPDLYETHQRQLYPVRPVKKYEVNYILDSDNYPFRSYNKLKSLYDDFDKTKFEGKN